MTHHRTRKAVIGITVMLVGLAAFAGVTLGDRVANGPGKDVPGVRRMSNAKRAAVLPAGMAVAPAARALAVRQPAPSVSEFAAEFVGSTNLYAQEHRDATRLGNAHCVQAAPGRYMCSYVVVRNGASTCHLMQARWTPDRASNITVTLAGRTARCASVRDAIRSLR